MRPINSWQEFQQTVEFFVDTANTYQFDNCAFSNGFALTGNGSYNYDDSLLTFEVDVTGLKDGSLTYTRDSEWAITVTGVYGGEKVDLSK